MSYIVNGKTFTSYPLMDEIAYSCKLILNGIVVKNEYVAHLYETEETLYNQEILFKCKLGSMTFRGMPYGADMLVAYGYDPITANQYVADIDLIPEADREPLLKFCMKYYIDHFVEKNKYYRSLMGLPEYGTTRYDIYVTESDFPDTFDTSTVDFSLPIHEQTPVVISALRSNGKIDQLIEANRSFNYSYLRYLSELSLDVYTCRKAGKWDILYLPNVNANIMFRFQELYNINKQIYLKRTYQNAYAFRSAYYDHMLIFVVLAQTVSDMIVDAPEWFIRKDIFDIRTVQFFLEAYGIPYFEEIPLKYQIRIVKNINKLIKYKSTRQNFEDIIDIFSLRETYIYRYYLYKRRKKDAQGHYVVDPDLNKMYDLNFIEVVLGDTYDNYIKNLTYRTPYDEITLHDEYWDGVDDHDVVKEKILAKDFTIEPTKYMTIKADIDYIAYQKQLIYLMGMIVDSRIDTNDVTLGVQSIYEGIDFRLSDIFIFIELLNYLENDLDSYIRRPEDNDESSSNNDDPGEYYLNSTRRGLSGLMINTDEVEETSWIKRWYPEFFSIDTRHRVFGFNPEADLEKVRKVVERGHISSSQKFYTLEYFGCGNFVVPNEDINSYERMLDIFEINLKCLNKLDNIICHGCTDEFETLLARYIFTELFTKEFDYGLYGEKEYLEQVLESRNYILWNFYHNLAIADDKESRNKDIATVINEIILNLEYYFDRDSLDYFFSFTTTSSFAYLIKYIYLMLNAFKSYKAHFIEPTVKYKFLYPSVITGNYTEFNDVILKRDVSWSKFDKMYIHDYMAKILIRYFKDTIRHMYVEVLNTFSGFEPKKDENYEFDGGYPNTPDEDYNKSINGTNSEMLVPYETIDGGFPYGRHGITKYMVDGKDEYIPDLEDNERVLELDGGNITDDFNTRNSYYQKFFKDDYNGGSPYSDNIANSNFFKMMIDNQHQSRTRVAARTGLEYSEDHETGEAVLKEVWREWMPILVYEAVKGDMNLLYSLILEGTIDSYMEQFLQDLEDSKVKVFMDELYHKKNHGIDLSVIELLYDWRNDRRLITGSTSDLHEYQLIWIEDTANIDTSRIIKYNL